MPSNAHSKSSKQWKYDMAMFTSHDYYNAAFQWECHEKTVATVLKWHRQWSLVVTVGEVVITGCTGPVERTISDVIISFHVTVNIIHVDQKTSLGTLNVFAVPTGLIRWRRCVPQRSRRSSLPTRGRWGWRGRWRMRTRSPRRPAMSSDTTNTRLVIHWSLVVQLVTLDTTL